MRTYREIRIREAQLSKRLEDLCGEPGVGENSPKWIEIRARREALAWVLGADDQRADDLIMGLKS